MLHAPAPEKHHPDPASARKARIGIWLFAAYALVYAGFVALNLLRPEWMEARTVLGMNLAVFYGFGLILLAIVMGMIYNTFCSRLENEMDESPKSGKGRAA